MLRTQLANLFFTTALTLLLSVSCFLGALANPGYEISFIAIFVAAPIFLIACIDYPGWPLFSKFIASLCVFVISSATGSLFANFNSGFNNFDILATQQCSFPIACQYLVKTGKFFSFIIGIIVTIITFAILHMELKFQEPRASSAATRKND